MKTTKTFILFAATIIISFSLNAQNVDVDDCKDSPMFPTRMTNYFIAECKSNFDAVEFNLAEGYSKMITKEGKKTWLQYNFNSESNQEKPSGLQILRNYENAAKKLGGTSLYVNAAEGLGTFQIIGSDKEIWVKVELGGNDNSDFYVLTIVEIELMKQEVMSDDIYKALNSDGFIALYLNFATGKSTIEASSDKQIDQIVQMMKNNPSLKISIEGHTDNIGTEKSNQTLSDDRAKAVMNAMIAKGIDKTRLVSKGFGQTKPIADNRTDEGKAKNRRVEIVKL